MESFDEDCISGLISNYYVSRMVKQHANSVLVGESSDELFGGYRMVLKHPKVKTSEKRVRLARKLVEMAYNTALRRLDRGWMANGVDYQIPFLDSRVVAFSRKIPMDWKIYGDNQIEKYVLREAFRDLFPYKSRTVKNCAFPWEWAWTISWTISSRRSSTPRRLKN